MGGYKSLVQMDNWFASTFDRRRALYQLLNKVIGKILRKKLWKKRHKSINYDTIKIRSGTSYTTTHKDTISKKGKLSACTTTKEFSSQN